MCQMLPKLILFCQMWGSGYQMLPTHQQSLASLAYYRMWVSMFSNVGRNVANLYQSTKNVHNDYYLYSMFRAQWTSPASPRWRPPAAGAAPPPWCRSSGPRGSPTRPPWRCRSCPFSAVPAPIFASKYAFFCIFQNLPDYPAEIFEIWQHFVDFATFAKCLLNFHKNCWFSNRFFAKILRLQRCKRMQIL